MLSRKGYAVYIGHRSVDPNELETKLSTEEGESWLDFLVDDEMSEEKQDKLERVKQILDDLPPVEADFVDLYYYQRKKQTDIAQMFGVSQPTVCYRLQRAADRIQFLMQLPCVSEEEIDSSMRRFLTEEIDVRIMVQMFRTTCQSEVAKRLDVSQGLVRHRFIKAIEKMRDAREYAKGSRFKVFMEEDGDYYYTVTFGGAEALLSEAVEFVVDHTDHTDRKFREPKIVSVPRLNSSVGRFYDVYAAISDNLNILRDVRRKSPEDEVLRLVW